MKPALVGNCIAVIFTSQLKKEVDRVRYRAMAEHMSALAAEQPGYLREESVRGEDGFGVSVSYWKDAERAIAWKNNAAHQAAQKAGKEEFYAWYQVRIGMVTREYGTPPESMQ